MSGGRSKFQQDISFQKLVEQNKYTEEKAQDTVGGMVTGNTEKGLAVTYDDTTGKLNFDVNDPLITINGVMSGSATITDLGNTTITLASRLGAANVSCNTVDFSTILTSGETTVQKALSKIDDHGHATAKISDFDTEVSNNTDVAANTIHRTSSGDDHTWINQDVTTTGAPTFAGITLTGDAVFTTKTPASAAATGTLGTIAWDSNYLYVCVAANSWKKIGIATW